MDIDMRVSTGYVKPVIKESIKYVFAVANN